MFIPPAGSAPNDTIHAALLNTNELLSPLTRCTFAHSARLHAPVPHPHPPRLDSTRLATSALKDKASGRNQHNDQKGTRYPATMSSLRLRGVIPLTLPAKSS
jgi:hypothetical protein